MATMSQDLDHRCTLHFWIVVPDIVKLTTRNSHHRPPEVELFESIVIIREFVPHLSFYTKALLSKVPRFQAFAKNQSTSALNLFYGGFHPLRILARLKTESISTPGIPWNHNTAIAKRFFIAIGT